MSLFRKFVDRTNDSEHEATTLQRVPLLVVLSKIIGKWLTG